MSFRSICSTFPEPPTSPQRTSSPVLRGPIHLPLKRTYAFDLPREQPSEKDLTRRVRTQRRKSTQRNKSTRRIREKEPRERAGENQKEPEETTAHPAKKRRIND